MGVGFGLGAGVGRDLTTGRVGVGFGFGFGTATRPLRDVGPDEVVPIAAGAAWRAGATFWLVGSAI